MKKISQYKLYLYFSILVIIVAILAIILGTVFGIKSKHSRTVSHIEITFHSKTGKEIAKRKFKLDEKISVSFSNKELELTKNEEFLGWSNIQNSKSYIVELKAKKESTDFAREILGNYYGFGKYYRSVNLEPFVESGHQMPFFNDGRHQWWWLGTEFPRSNPSAQNILNDGSLDWNNVHSVLGVVVCARF